MPRRKKLIRSATEFVDNLASIETPEEADDVEKTFKIESEARPATATKGSNLADLILRERRENGYLTIITFGKQRTGKSIYNIRVAKMVYEALGYKMGWRDFIKKYVVFRLDDMLARLREAALAPEPLPVLVWDDAGVHGSSMLPIFDRRVSMMLTMLFQVIGTAVTAFMMNTPNPAFIMKNLRGVDNIHILIVKVDSTYSEARAYKFSFLPNGELASMPKKIFVDRFKREMPEYEYYYNMRRRYTAEVLDMFSKLGKEKEEEEGRPRRVRIPMSRVIEAMRNIEVATKYKYPLFTAMIIGLWLFGYSWDQIGELVGMSGWGVRLAAQQATRPARRYTKKLRAKYLRVDPNRARELWRTADGRRKLLPE